MVNLVLSALLFISILEKAYYELDESMQSSITSFKIDSQLVVTKIFGIGGAELKDMWRFDGTFDHLNQQSTCG